MSFIIVRLHFQATTALEYYTCQFSTDTVQIMKTCDQELVFFFSVHVDSLTLKQIMQNQCVTIDIR